MNKFFMSASAVALCLGSSNGFAQDSEKTTTTVSSPSGLTETTTTTTKTSDGYKRYVRTIAATKHYNTTVFMGPAGYVYTRYAIGDRAPSTLLGGGYTLVKYSTYGLESPPHGLTWIRAGDDALLVDGKTGEVVQTDYGLFSN
jgi:Ni/Co efflux regulator RcnB